MNTITDLLDPKNTRTLNLVLVRFCNGDHMTALLLSQLWWWKPRIQDSNGWMAKTNEDWDKEMAMSKYQVARAVKMLKSLNIGMEVKRKRSKYYGGLSVNHYRYSQEALEKALQEFLQIPDQSEETSLSIEVKKLDLPYTKITTKTTNPKTDSKSESVLPPPAADPDKNSSLPETPLPERTAIPHPCPLCVGTLAFKDGNVYTCTVCGQTTVEGTSPAPTELATLPAPVREQIADAQFTAAADAEVYPPLPESLTNPHCNRKHLTACLAWALDNYNYEAIQRPLNMLLGKDGAGEWHAHRLALDNTDNPNKGPVSDYEILAFGAWLRMKHPLSSEYRKYRPQTAEKIARNMELFRGEREYATLVTTAQNGHPQVPGIDEMIRLNMNGNERSTAIAALGMHLSRPVSPGSHAPPPPPNPDPDASEEQWATPEQIAELRAFQAEVFAAKRVENLGLELDED
jgi:hypothetical protein